MWTLTRPGTSSLATHGPSRCSPVRPGSSEPAIDGSVIDLNWIVSLSCSALHFGFVTKTEDLDYRVRTFFQDPSISHLSCEQMASALAHALFAWFAAERNFAALRDNQLPMVNLMVRIRPAGNVSFVEYALTNETREPWTRTRQPRPDTWAPSMPSF